MACIFGVSVELAAASTLHTREHKMDKSKLLHCLGKDYYHSKTAWKLFMQYPSDTSSKDLAVCEAIYRTKREAYLDCGVITWEDIDNTEWIKEK